MSEWREFWLTKQILNGERRCQDVEPKVGVEFMIHVIEHSAFEKSQARVRELEDAIKAILKRAEELSDCKPQDYSKLIFDDFIELSNALDNVNKGGEK